MKPSHLRIKKKMARKKKKKTAWGGGKEGAGEHQL